MAPRLIVLGWDSATFDVIDPLIEEGRLPALAALIERGYRAELRSTWPPMTDCAWTSAFTGRDAGDHGIFGSWYRAPGVYACTYFSSRDRRAPALWEMADGPRYLVWNVPMTYPPDRVAGAMVAGYGAPPGARFTSPGDLQRELESRWPLDDILDRAPHGTLDRFAEDLGRGLRVQAEALPWAANRVGADVVLAVWPHVDRAQHFFWRFRGTDHEFGDVVDRVYVEMDRATAVVVEAFPEADVLVVSDHGAGPLLGDVNLGSWLSARGDATYRGSTRAGLSSVAWQFPPGLRRLGRRVAPGLARKAMAARLAGQLAPFDWARTRAFLGFHSDLWVNLSGREPDGSVSEREAPGFIDELAGELTGIVDPRTGAPVIAAVHRRDEIFTGPCAAMGPDLMLDTWSAGYRVAPGRTATEEIVSSPEALAGVHEPWSSDHRPEGIFVAAGPRIASGAGRGLSLLDLCPTGLALLEQPVPDELEGKVAVDALDPSFLERHPVASTGAKDRRVDRDVSAFSEDEAAAVAAHLKDLGYIE